MLSKLTQGPSTTTRGGFGIEDASDLSLIQEQVWLDEQITPGTAAYNIPTAVHFEGPLDDQVLERSVREIAGAMKSCAQHSQLWGLGRSRPSKANRLPSRLST